MVMSEETAIKKLIDRMMEIDQLKRELKEKEKQREELITILIEGTFKTEIKAIQEKEYKEYYNSKHDLDELLKRLNSKKYNCPDLLWE